MTRKQASKQRCPYSLPRCANQYLYVVAPAGVALQVVRHVQKVDGAGGVGRQRQTAAVQRQRDAAESAGVHVRREVVAPGEDFQRHREETTARPEAQAESYRQQ